jgi:citrate/tricarballylate utilization protein
VAHSGWNGLVHSDGNAASPYHLLPYWALLALMLVAGSYSVVVTGFAARAYWHEVGGSAGRFRLAPVGRAIWYAATLRYLRGGGGDCYYPVDEEPSPVRRHLHGLVAYGFGLCLVSTVAAGVEQDLIGIDPPYPWLSVPVISGTVGGVGLVLGCIGLLILKARSSAVTSFKAMTIKDYGLLVALSFLGLSGLATLLLRDTAAFGLVLLIHLAAILECFEMAPYSKFVHLVFRFAALVRDNLEIDQQKKGPASTRSH